MELSDLRVGDRVELEPATDRWMMGDRFGEVVRKGRIRVTLHFERSGKRVAMHPVNVWKRVEQ